MSKDLKVKRSKQPIPVWLIGYNETEYRFFDPINNQDIIKGETYEMNSIIKMEDYVEYIKSSSEDYSLSSFYVCFSYEAQAIKFYLDNYVVGENSKGISPTKKRDVKLFEALIPANTEYIKTPQYFISMGIKIKNIPGWRIKNLIGSSFESPIKSAKEDIKVWVVANKIGDDFIDPCTSVKLFPGTWMKSVVKREELEKLCKTTNNGMSVSPDPLNMYYRSYSSKSAAEEVYYKEKEKKKKTYLIPGIIPQGKEYFVSADGNFIYSFDISLSSLSSMEKEIKEEGEVQPKKEEPMERKTEETKKEDNIKKDKKDWEEWVAYNKHEELTPPWDTATSSVTCIDYWYKYGPEENETTENQGRSLLVEICDCRGKIRLHNRGGDLQTFKNKISTLINNLQDFLNHLEECGEDGDSIIQKSKENFPEKYKNQ